MSVDILKFHRWGEYWHTTQFYSKKLKLCYCHLLSIRHLIIKYTSFIWKISESAAWIEYGKSSGQLFCWWLYTPIVAIILKCSHAKSNFRIVRFFLNICIDYPLFCIYKLIYKYPHVSYFIHWRLFHNKKYSKIY